MEPTTTAEPLAAATGRQAQAQGLVWTGQIDAQDLVPIGYVVPKTGWRYTGSQEPQNGLAAACRGRL